MKISNKKYIERLGVVLLLSVLIILSALTIHFLIVREVDILLILLLLLLTSILLFLYKLNYKEFENSGFVVTVKKNYLVSIKSITFPVIEFPLDLLKEYYIRGQSIYLIIGKNDGNKAKHTVRIPIRGFTDSQRQELLSLLKHR